MVLQPWEQKEEHDLLVRTVAIRKLLTQAQLWETRLMSAEQMHNTKAKRQAEKVLASILLRISKIARAAEIEELAEEKFPA